MKLLLGLFLISTTSHSFAGTTAGLFLRALVPVTVSVEVQVENGVPRPRVNSNSRSPASLPKTSVTLEKSTYVVSVIQP